MVREKPCWLSAQSFCLDLSLLLLTFKEQQMKTIKTFHTEKEAMDYCMDRPDENLSVMSDVFSGVYEVIDWDKN